jgi:hypothetical protein
MTSPSATDPAQGNGERSDQLRAQLDDLVDRLAEHYADVPAEAVRSQVLAESERFSGARVRAFIPVLVERAVRSHLGIPANAPAQP